MNTNLIKRFIDNKELVSLYAEGMNLLMRSGVFEVLRDNGRVVQASPEQENYVAFQAALANWSAGYNEALDQLINFRELFIERKVMPNPEMTFGSLETAVDKGDLTKEEADAIRSGTSVTYDIDPSKSGGNTN